MKDDKLDWPRQILRLGLLHWLGVAASIATVGALVGAVTLGLLSLVGGWLSGYADWAWPYQGVLGFYYALYRYLVHYPFVVPLVYLWEMTPTPFKNINMTVAVLSCDIWLGMIGFAVLQFTRFDEGSLSKWVTKRWPGSRKLLLISLTLISLPLLFALAYGICALSLGWLSAIGGSVWEWLFAR